MLQETTIPQPRCSSSEVGGAEPDFSVAENLCRVASNEWVNDEYKHLVLDAPDVALRALPGQFFHLACPPDVDGAALLRRPMSLYKVAPTHRQIEFLYKVHGVGTRGLARLEVGNQLDALGPVGRGFALPANAKHILLLARGVGLATLTPLADLARTLKVSVTAVLSARTPDLIMSADYLREAGAQVVIVTDDDKTSDVEHVETLVREIHATRPLDYVATCGSNRLLILLQRLAMQLDIPGQIALEQHMGCALGACYACVRPFKKQACADQLTYRRVCWEGPVFDLQETVSW
ncbi:dihydroorotate dehydrogenase electron transfer subunit [Cupriavidus sp. CuC1]|uniref:dihydroorotate dehydrogenase electron transfer subunit n=1 Tax=Cupriavidus sp. CuC1 TaxID=3373131 RepID=UPI0037CFF30D